MKEYFRFFSIPFAVVGILAVVTLVVTLVKNEPVTASASGNTQRTTTERVFDYADKLTDAEEDKLRAQIEEAEQKTQCDIVVVTLNESLVEYAAQYESIIGPVDTSECVMVYADNFYDEHMFGYDEAYGDGVLFLDNWYREADGYVYSWMSTCGKAEDRYSSAMIDNLLDDALCNVDEDPYGAYSKMVTIFVRDMTGGTDSNAAGVLKPLYIVIGAIVIAVVFLIVNWSSKKGKRTTTDRTYVVGGNPVFRRREDRFLYKNVTKHKIEKSSSSGGGGGGGGHHMSSGGHSHGGGGHRR